MGKQVENIIKYLTESAQLFQQVQDRQLGNRLIALREWQCERLLTSHAKALETPQYVPAINFFVDELYGPKDFSQRDQDIAKVVPKMEKWLPVEALESLEVAIHLNALSQELDVTLLEHLGEQPITSQSYAQAYAASDNAEQRKLQIDYIEQLGLDLASVVKIPGIGMILVMARTPAKLAGLETLQNFLEDGFDAFKKIGEIEDFILPMVSTERDIMQRLFAGEQCLPDITTTNNH